MTSLAFAVVIVLVGQTAYHTAARGASTGSSAYELIAVAYAVALIVTLVAGAVANELGPTAPSARTIARGAVLGCSVPLVEIGYIYAYRRGLPISTGPLAVLALSTVILIPIGVYVFSEHLTWRVVVGACVAIAGIWLMRS